MENTTDEWADMSISERNNKVMAAIDAAGEGQIKAASAAGTNMIRRRIRERGFARRILPMQSIGNDKLNRVLEHDRPVRIEDMEPDSVSLRSKPASDLRVKTSHL